MIRLQHRPVHAGQVTTRETPTGVVLFNLRSGRHCRGYSLNEIGGRVWALCDGSRTVGEIIGLIRDEYEAPDGRVQMDVLALLRELAAEGLVDTGGRPGAAGALTGPPGVARMFLCLQITCFAVAVPLIGRLSLPRLEALLGRGSRRGQPDPARVSEIISCVGAVIRLGARARIIRADCVTRGLTLYHFLRRAGMDVALCFGARHEQGAMAAHCWLVHDGQPYLEPTDPRQRYDEISRLSPRSAAAGRPDRSRV